MEDATVAPVGPAEPDRSERDLPMTDETPAGGVILAVTYRAAPGNAERVAANLVEMANAVGEREPGCLTFDVCRSEQDPDVFFLYEHYVDEDAFDAHRSTPHFLELIKSDTWPLLESRQPATYRFLAAAHPAEGSARS